MTTTTDSEMMTFGELEKYLSDAEASEAAAENEAHKTTIYFRYRDRQNFIPDDLPSIWKTQSQVAIHLASGQSTRKDIASFFIDTGMYEVGGLFPCDECVVSDNDSGLCKVCSRNFTQHVSEIKASRQLYFTSDPRGIEVIRRVEVQEACHQ